MLEPWSKEMVPVLATDPELADVFAELMNREPIFHRPEFGTTRVDLERMTVPDFWEVGASGRRYSRQYVIDELEKRYREGVEDDWEAGDFQCRRLSPDTYLLTYTLVQEKVRLTRRSTIWRQIQDGWQIVYHQGTIVQDV